MDTLKLKIGSILNGRHFGAALVLIACSLWQALPYVLRAINPTVGLLDESVWQLLLFAIVCFLVLLGLSLLLLKLLFVAAGLPPISTFVPQFNTLTVCQQLTFYWASFALLLLAAVMSLVAVF